MATTLPTLTREGFITDPQAILLKLYEYFLTSDYSSSVLFYGQISSMRKIRQEGGSDIEYIRDKARDAYYSLASSYFTNTGNTYNNLIVDVNIVNVNENDTSLYQMQLEASITLDGKTYSITNNLIEDTNSFIGIANSIDYLILGE